MSNTGNGISREILFLFSFIRRFRVILSVLSRGRRPIEHPFEGVTRVNRYYLFLGFDIGGV